MSYTRPLVLHRDPVVINVTILSDGVEEELEDIELTLVQNETLSPLEPFRVLSNPTVRISVKDRACKLYTIVSMSTF